MNSSVVVSDLYPSTMCLIVAFNEKKVESEY